MYRSGEWTKVASGQRWQVDRGGEHIVSSLKITQDNYRGAHLYLECFDIWSKVFGTGYTRLA